MTRVGVLVTRVSELKRTDRAAAPQRKQVDPYYRTKEWENLRQQALLRDLYKCAIPKCPEQAVVVDHIKSRKDGGVDDLSNLRCLCRRHDNRWKEDHMGQRRGSKT